MSGTPRDYPGIAALVLAVALGTGWGVAIILQATPFTDPITAAGAQLLNGIGQVLAGALAAFLGVGVGRRAQRDETDLRDAEPPQGAPPNAEV